MFVFGVISVEVWETQLLVGGSVYSVHSVYGNKVLLCPSLSWGLVPAVWRLGLQYDPSVEFSESAVRIGTLSLCPWVLLW